MARHPLVGTVHRYHTRRRSDVQLFIQILLSIFVVSSILFSYACYHFLAIHYEQGAVDPISSSSTTARSNGGDGRLHGDERKQRERETAAFANMIPGRLRPLQTEAASAPDGRPNPKDYVYREYDVPKEDQIPFVDLDLDESVKRTVLDLARDKPDVYGGREHLVGMLLEMDQDIASISDEMWRQVPTWDEIQKTHGTKPVVHGLETCRSFRDAVPPLDRHLAIAGLFSTGTNLLAVLLQHNCGIPERIDKLGRRRGHGCEWQVPYGKHNPVWLVRDQGFKIRAKRSHIGKIPIDDCMTAVMVRHPLDWIGSMCRNGYTMQWRHRKKNCPNLFEGNVVRTRFGGGTTTHDSVVHLWNEWNHAYYNATSYPRLLVRFEDVIFYPKQLSRVLCGCVGGQLYKPKENDGVFHYVIDSAVTGPGHGSATHRNGLVDAWIKYGKARDYDGAFRKSDIDYIRRHVDRDVLQSLNWTIGDEKEQSKL